MRYGQKKGPLVKRLFFVVIAAALLWSGYWVFGARSVQSGLTDWFDARRAEGWVAEYDDFGVRGFPNRFDATWQDLTLADPETGIAWTMPIFQLLALSYQPNHVIAAWPDRMTLATPTEKLTITSETLRASLRLAKSTALELDSSVLEGRDIAFSGAETGHLGELHLAAQRQGDTTYRIGLDARDLSPPAPVLRGIFGDQALPDTMQLAHLDATVTFDRPWDISAIEVSRPQPQKIALTDLRAAWGVMEFRATGELEIDAAGRASGPLSLQAEEWLQMLEIAEASGAMTDLVAKAARGLLTMAADASGNPNSIDVQLTLKDGIAYYGVLPVFALPPVILR